MDDYELAKLQPFLDRISRCVRYISSEEAEECGFKHYHIPFLLAIGKNPGISQKGLCERIPFDKSRVSIVVRDLMDRGYAVNGSTGKVWSLSLTPSGEAASRKSREIIAGIYGGLFAGVPEGDMEILKRVLQHAAERAESIASKTPLEPGLEDRGLKQTVGIYKYQEQMADWHSDGSRTDNL